jgi:hypothetical protein
MSVKQIIRVTDQFRAVPTKKDPSKSIGFQRCGLQEAPGMFASFDRMYSPDRGEKPLPPGDYEVVNFRVAISRDGRANAYYDLQAVKA